MHAEILTGKCELIKEKTNFWDMVRDHAQRGQVLQRLVCAPAAVY